MKTPEYVVTLRLRPDELILDGPSDFGTQIVRDADRIEIVLKVDGEPVYAWELSAQRLPIKGRRRAKVAKVTRK